MNEDIALPPLREDLALFPGPVMSDGSPSWTIHDPVRNRYHRIGQSAFNMLSLWHVGTAGKLLAVLKQRDGYAPDMQDIVWMVKFVQSHFLNLRQSREDVAQLRTVAKAGKSVWYKKLLHNYLFFRVPLVRPQSFLEATLKASDVVFSRFFVIALCCLGALGLFLVTRQWDVFFATFMHFFTWEGMIWYGGALLFAKVLHELGHAYTAARLGCRIPSMGVAFLVMWPVLYTDTSDAWRLTDKRQRLAIGAAGMLAEIGLALIATFLWSFLPEGAMKSAAFLVATVTWVMTLAINLNPFMRFDGYYLLSDWLEVENLQDRAFLRAKWWLRERLFGWGESAPEAFPSGLGNALIAYAIATWVYRLVLFLGIAFLVYAFFFKVLGIFLFIVEIVWFIALPISNEFREWMKRRDKIVLNRPTIRTLLVFSLLLMVFFVPWKGSLTLPAVLDAEKSENIFAPRAAQVALWNMTSGQAVRKGDVLAVLRSDDLDFEIAQIERQIALNEELIRREAAGGGERLKIRVLRQDLDRQKTTLQSLLKSQARLTLYSQMDGTLTYLNQYVQTGQWVNEDTLLAQITDKTGAKLTAYVNEEDVERLPKGAKALFYPERLQQGALDVVLADIADVNAAQLDTPYLASIFGGDIAVEPNDKKQLIPLKGIYRVSFALPESELVVQSAERGHVIVESQRQSIAHAMIRQIWAVLIRESAF